MLASKNQKVNPDTEIIDALIIPLASKLKMI